MPWKVICPDHGETIVEDSNFDKPAHEGGIGQITSDTTGGKPVFLGNCKICTGTFRAEKIEMKPVENKG